MGKALQALGREARIQVVFDDALTAGKQAPAVRGRMAVDAVFTELLAGSGLAVSRSGSVYVVAGQPSMDAGARLGVLPAAPDADAPRENIVVTGTRIVRPNLKAASPITSVGAAEIRAQGAVNLEEVTNRRRRRRSGRDA